MCMLMLVSQVRLFDFEEAEKVLKEWEKSVKLLRFSSTTDRCSRVFSAQSGFMKEQKHCLKI